MSGMLFRGLGLTVIAAGLFLAGCSSQPARRAPVEDRNVASTTAPTPDPATAGVKQPPGFENAGKPGYYTVKPGDTLIRIGLESGQSHRDIARWNSLENPNRIEVGQVLRVLPPNATSNGVAVTKPVSGSSVASAPLASASAPAKASSTPVAAATPSTVTSAGDDDMGWIWPGNGAVLAGFDEAKNKGLDIGGGLGDPVLAVADGKVVYAGSGLRGYGNLIILKHNNTYLTAYAHNKALQVKEDQTVKKGQKIAEMGDSDADRVKLHFEVRRQGKPVDPIKYLPAR
jgi:lipoprotein NlpD